MIIAPTLNMVFKEGVYHPLLTFSRASTATRINSLGLIEAVAADVLRIDHDPVTGACKGILIEEARTRINYVSALPTSPEARTVAAVAHTISFYGTGSVALTGAHAATVTGGGAYPTRTTLTFTPSAGTLTMTPSGSVVDLQLEVGSFATSVIRGEASAVTRAADVATVALSGFAFNASEGTLYAEAISAIGGSGQRVVDLNDGSTLKIMQISNAGVYNGYVKDGTVQASIVGGTWAHATLAKLALGYKINDFALAANGAISGTDVSGSVPAGLTGMYIGSQVGGVYLNGHIKHLQYFPRRMSNADLQTLTR